MGAGGGRERERVLGDEVPAAHLGGIQLGVGREHVDRALDRLGGLGPPGTADGPVGVVLVTTALISSSIFGIWYTPLAIIAVRLARNAPMPG